MMCRREHCNILALWELGLLVPPVDRIGHTSPSIISERRKAYPGQTGSSGGSYGVGYLPARLLKKLDRRRHVGLRFHDFRTPRAELMSASTRKWLLQPERKHTTSAKYGRMQRARVPFGSCGTWGLHRDPPDAPSVEHSSFKASEWCGGVGGLLILLAA